ncbi:hypothetical protein BDZ94DRAFT_1294724 [Collybia nuda]|uniref:Uncharacterized protein n=1 Tax=Collybia nuda TaxID=64659 RepID=A0A9P6CIM8_9AGAR|nr:hypothetical protein BDZ94DRAFT_1294724 [Collybia nuda]
MVVGDRSQKSKFSANSVVRTVMSTCWGMSFWNTAGGTQLSGLILYPPSYDASWGTLLTAIFFIHRGPYPMPGHITEIEAIGRPRMKPRTYGVAATGALLAAWGVTKTKTRFKTAIIGAGASNWEGMVMDSGSPEFEPKIGQSAPWDRDGWEESTKHDTLCGGDMAMERFEEAGEREKEGGRINYYPSKGTTRVALLGEIGPKICCGGFLLFSNHEYDLRPPVGTSGQFYV